MIFFWKRRQETVQQTFTIGWVLLTYKYSAVHTGKFVYAGFTNFFSAKKNIITVRISQFLFSNFKKSNKKDSVKLIYYNSISQVFFLSWTFLFFIFFSTNNRIQSNSQTWDNKLRPKSRFCTPFALVFWLLLA